jgi:diguanylate cyclase (GGDEF)-like protein/PAS domain S-box-containing protein
MPVIGRLQNVRVLRLPFAAGAFVSAICLTILALMCWEEWNARSFHLKSAEVDMANLSRSLAQHAEDSFAVLDVSILGLVARLEKDGAGPEVISTLSGILALRKNDSRRIHGLFIYDEHGRWLATSEKISLEGLNNSDRDYFRYHKENNRREALIGRPVESRATGDWIITASRRFNHPDGSFAGVVLASVKSEYFSRFFSQFETGAKGSINLLSTDGIMMARSHDNGELVGRDMSKLPFFLSLASKPRSGTYSFKSPLDGLDRLSFYWRSDRYPIVVLATMSEAEVLAPWRRDFMARMAIFGTLTLIIGVIGVLLVRQLYMRQNFAVALAAKEADFRLLAEESSDMVTRIGLDENLRYVSPSSTRVVGWAPEQLMGKSALIGVIAEDRPAVEATVAALKRGDISDARLLYRTRHKQNKEIWLESTMRVTRHPETREIDGVVAISRDVTKQRYAQEQLETLAITDGLTGLANRRHFDQRLEDEWARAHRDHKPLAVLLIDVDHFKKFNDEYGHPAGDACLTAIAKAIASEARRPADLAARYGGEEFVLLLPNTDHAGCELVGENLRRKLRQLDMLHVHNLPSMRVSVSVGGAVQVASDQGSPALLLQAADHALYAAKDRGRDRLVMSDTLNQDVHPLAQTASHR